jgi:prepilin peptidase CpaA
MDLFTMTIPNRISLFLIAAFVVVFPVAAFGWSVLASHLGAGALMLVVGIAMFARGWLGGGDAKILAVASLWLGLDKLPEYLLLVSIWGGALAMALLFYRSLTPPIWLVGQEWAMRLHRKTTGIPYGIALAAAGLCIYPKTPWFASLAM